MKKVRGTFFLSRFLGLSGPIFAVKKGTAYLFLVLSLVVVAGAARAQTGGEADAADAITPGKLVCVPTFHNASVYLVYTGDRNGDSRAAIRYRKTGGDTWREAHPAVKIRVPRLGGRLWTGSLLFLEEGTAYDVNVTLTDPDGVNGKTEISGTFTTLKPPNVSKGETIVVAPGESIRAAFERAVPGTTVLVRKGVYYETVSGTKSGTPDAPITLKGEPGAKVFGSDATLAAGDGWKSEGGPLYSAQIPPVNYRIVAHEKLGRLHHHHDLDQLKAETHQCNRTEGEAHKIKGGWVQDGNRLYVILPDHSDPRKGGVHVSVRDTCVELINSNHVTIEGLELAYAGRTYGACIRCDACSNIRVHQNHIHHFRKRGVLFRGFPGRNNLVEHNRISDFPVADWPWSCVKGHDCEDGGIDFKTEAACVARYNVCSDLFNGIVPSSWGMSPDVSRDTDVYGNVLVRIGDDAIEPDGAAVNQRYYHNLILGTKTMAFSIAPVDVGPAYFVRNVVAGYERYILKAHGATKGHVFFYHNSAYVAKDAVADPERVRILNSDPSAGCGGIVAKNNMFWSLHYMIRRGGKPLAPCAFDYNAYYNPLGTYRFEWCGEKTQSLEDFRKTGEEAHGFVADPRYADADANDLTLSADSPLRDKGVVIPGVNDDTPDGKPDIGAYEFDAPRWDKIPSFPTPPAIER